MDVERKIIKVVQEVKLDHIVHFTLMVSEKVGLIVQDLDTGFLKIFQSKSADALIDQAEDMIAALKYRDMCSSCVGNVLSVYDHTQSVSKCTEFRFICFTADDMDRVMRLEVPCAKG